MNKIYFRLLILLALLGAIYYVSAFKYKGVMRSFFVEKAQLTHQSQYVILSEKGDTLGTEFFEIQKGLHNNYYEMKKFNHGQEKISEAFRVVTDTVGRFIWGSYENFDPVTKDSITRKFALYSMFHEDEYIRSMPVVDYREKEKSEIDPNGDHFMIQNGLASVMNLVPPMNRKEHDEFKLITIDTVAMIYNLSTVKSIYQTSDTSDNYQWTILDADNSDTLWVIKGKKSLTTFNWLESKKDKFILKKVSGSDYKYKEIDPNTIKNGIK